MPAMLTRSSVPARPPRKMAKPRTMKSVAVRGRDHRADLRRAALDGGLRAGQLQDVAALQHQVGGERELLRAAAEGVHVDAARPGRVGQGLQALADGGALGHQDLGGEEGAVEELAVLHLGGVGAEDRHQRGAAAADGEDVAGLDAKIRLDLANCAVAAQAQDEDPRLGEAGLGLGDAEADDLGVGGHRVGAELEGAVAGLDARGGAAHAEALLEREGFGLEVDAEEARAEHAAEPDHADGAEDVADRVGDRDVGDQPVAVGVGEAEGADRLGGGAHRRALGQAAGEQAAGVAGVEVRGRWPRRPPSRGRSRRRPPPAAAASPRSGAAPAGTAGRRNSRCRTGRAGRGRPWPSARPARARTGRWRGRPGASP